MITIKNIKSDYLYLMWKEPQSRLRYKVGVLKKSEKYEFKYVDDIKEIVKKGFNLLVSFPDINKKYISDRLFPELLSRIPGPTRVDIKDILEKYELKEYDSFELLKRSGAKTSLDTLEFIDPILNFRSKNIIRKFYIAGTRYYCTKNNEEKINIGDKVNLIQEPSNKYDKFAIKMIINDVFVGYIPIYYSEVIYKYLNKKENNKYVCTVIGKTGKCEECIKVKLVLNPTLEEIE